MSGMDWAKAAATVSDLPEWEGLSDPPDDPRQDQDFEFWQAVQALVNQPEPELTESIWDELEHPRGREGRWIVSSLHEGAHYRGLKVALPDSLPHEITVGGERWRKVPNPHITMFDSRRVTRVAPEVDAGTLKQMADQVQAAPVSVTSIDPSWHVAQKAGRRSLVLPVKVEGTSDLYDKLSAQAGKTIPPPPLHVTVYTTPPGAKGIGLAHPDEWTKLTRKPTASEHADLQKLDARELAEADIYTEALHPRDRLGKWMRSVFGEVLAKPADKKGREPTPYRPAQWVDTGQDFETMAHQAAQLLHPDGTSEEHDEIAKAVVADRPAPKNLSKAAKDVTKKLRTNSTPTGLWGKYIYKLHSIATDAHAGQTDHGGNPYMGHVEAVADSVTDEAKPVALFHDALEDTELTPERLKEVLTEPKVTTPEQAQQMVDAIQLLTRPDDRTPGAYERYIERLKNEPGKAGELAREVKRADLQHNLGRMTPDIIAAKPNLKPRYEAALKELSPTRAPITQRGAAENIGRVVGKDAKTGKLIREKLDRQVVYDRLDKLYEASVDAGTAEAEKRWYQDAHDQIDVLAEKYSVDPHTLAAMVAATSPQMEWRHEFEDGSIKFPNLDLAIHAINVARDYPNEPAPKLIDRLVEESKQRTPEEQKKEPSELGGLGESMLKAIRIYRGEDPERVLNAPKTRSFMNNLAYPDQATTVTMDEHMGRAVLGKSTNENYSKSTDGVLDELADGSGYTWVADVVKQLAADKGVLPHQAQAIVWVAQKAVADAWKKEQQARAKAAKGKS